MNTPGFFCLDQITAEVATGIPQLKASTLKIYPNPADNQIMLDQIDGILEIYEISGSLAMTKTLNGIVPIDISVLRTGVYIANVVQKDQIFTTRLMASNPAINSAYGLILDPMRMTCQSFWRLRAGITILYLSIVRLFT